MVLTAKTQVITKKCTEQINSCKLGKIQRMKHPNSTKTYLFIEVFCLKNEKKNPGHYIVK